MNFSIKTTIREFVAPDHRLSCSSRLWQQILAELHRRGQRRHESGAFLLGISHEKKCRVTAAIYYDELDPQAYSTGVCILHGGSFAKLWAICRDKNLTVVADAHTHPHGTFQSQSDRTNPMIARSGHIAIIIPNFAHPPIRTNELGIFEYRGQHEWTERTSFKSPGFFYTGIWG